MIKKITPNGKQNYKQRKISIFITNTLKISTTLTNNKIFPVCSKFYDKKKHLFTMFMNFLLYFNIVYKFERLLKATTTTIPHYNNLNIKLQSIT